MTLATDLEALRGKQAVVEKKANPVVDALAKSTNALRSVLPKHITPERMSRMALGILRTNQSLARVAEALDTTSDSLMRGTGSREKISA
jgi:hypothetical protein